MIESSKKFLFNKGKKDSTIISESPLPPPPPPSSSTHSQYPTLESVINNQSDCPYTLANLRKYLSTIHCKEPLEFLLLANDFNQMFDQLQINKSIEQEISIRLLWNEIVKNFLLDSSPQELNIPGDIKEYFHILDNREFITCDNYKHLQYAMESAKDIIKENNYMMFIQDQIQNREKVERSLNDTYIIQHHVKGHGRGYSIASQSFADETQACQVNQLRHSGLPVLGRKPSKEQSNNESETSLTSPTSSFWSDSVIHIPRIKRDSQSDLSEDNNSSKSLPLLKRMSGKLKLRQNPE